jgi:hypothetical protein
MYFDANALVSGLYILYCNLLVIAANVVESLSLSFLKYGCDPGKRGWSFVATRRSGEAAKRAR